MDSNAKRLIAELQLSPHPEGGWFRRIHESVTTVEQAGRTRPALTAIHFLLTEGQYSHWHCVDADECWHWQCGDALELLVFDPVTRRLETARLQSAQQGRAMHVVPAGHWQMARAPGASALMVCTVSPGFVWEGFRLLDADVDRELAEALDRALAGNDSAAATQQDGNAARLA